MWLSRAVTRGGSLWLTQDLTDRSATSSEACLCCKGSRRGVGGEPGRLWRCRPQAETIGSYFGILHAAKRSLSPMRCATSRIASLTHREGLDGRTPSRRACGCASCVPTFLSRPSLERPGPAGLRESAGRCAPLSGVALARRNPHLYVTAFSRPNGTSLVELGLPANGKHDERRSERQPPRFNSMERNRGGARRRNPCRRCRRRQRFRLEKRKSPQGLRRDLPAPRRSAEQWYCHRRDHPVSLASCMLRSCDRRSDSRSRFRRFARVPGYV